MPKTPLKEIRATEKKSIKWVVWEQEDGRRSYTLSKSYKLTDGDWKEVKITFFEEEIPHVAECTIAIDRYATNMAAGAGEERPAPKGKPFT